MGVFEDLRDKGVYSEEQYRNVVRRAKELSESRKTATQLLKERLNALYEDKKNLEKEINVLVFDDEEDDERREELNKELDELDKEIEGLHYKIDELKINKSDTNRDFGEGDSDINRYFQ